MRKRRKNHSARFKAKVALEAIKGDRSISEPASLHEIDPAQIERCLKSVWTRLITQTGRKII